MLVLRTNGLGWFCPSTTAETWGRVATSVVAPVVNRNGSLATRPCPRRSVAVTLHSYEAFGPMEPVTKAKLSGVVFVKTSCRDGSFTSVTVYDADDRAWRVTDQYGRTTETLYDPSGSVAVTIDPFGGRTTYDYDARGDLIRTLYPDGTETRTAYDGMGRVQWQTDRYKTNSNPAANYVDNLTTALVMCVVVIVSGPPAP